MPDEPEAGRPSGRVVVKRSCRRPDDNLIAYVGPPAGQVFERLFGVESRETHEKPPEQPPSK